MSLVGVAVNEGCVCAPGLGEATTKMGWHAWRDTFIVSISEGHACHARGIAMDNQTVLRGPDKRVLPKAQPPILMVALTFWDRS